MLGCFVGTLFLHFAWNDSAPLFVLIGKPKTDKTFGYKYIRKTRLRVERYFTKSRKIIGNILLPNIWLVIRFDLIFITCVSLMSCCFCKWLDFNKNDSVHWVSIAALILHHVLLTSNKLTISICQRS